jgi:hypothetical protein
VAALVKVGGWASHVIVEAADAVPVPDGIWPAAPPTTCWSRNESAGGHGGSSPRAAGKSCSPRTPGCSRPARSGTGTASGYCLSRTPRRARTFPARYPGGVQPPGYLVRYRVTTASPPHRRR